MRRAFVFLVACCSVPAQTAETEGQISRFSSGYEFVSALAWSKDGYLLVADAPGGKITRIDNKGAAVWRQDLRATGLAFSEKGDLYICEAPLRRVVMLDRKAKSIEVLASAWEGKPLNGPRGVAATKNGYVFFTDPAFASADLKRELPFYGIFRVSPKGQVDLVSKLTSRPSGLALSQDGRTLYAATADDRTILAWAVDKNGTASGQRIFAVGLSGVPDGIAVGPEGNIWVAARDVEVFSPDGNRVNAWKFADKPSQIEFGEEDLHTAFVGAGNSVYRLRLPDSAAGGSRH